MEFVTIFREFGYPAVVTGALLWIYVTEFKRVREELKAIKEELKTGNMKQQEINLKIDEFRQDLKDLERR